VANYLTRYATPAPAAFDIANHFAEWGGFECDYNLLPTRAHRKQFLGEYLRSYHFNLQDGSFATAKELNELYDQIDLYRGLPGLYWGIWALIQAQSSKIDFDYAKYAEIRLGEYFAWRGEPVEGEGIKEKMEVRESRWAQDS
jgi:ethanolamine kinase